MTEFVRLSYQLLIDALSLIRLGLRSFRFHFNRINDVYRVLHRADNFIQSVSQQLFFDFQRLWLDNYAVKAILYSIELLCFHVFSNFFPASWEACIRMRRGLLNDSDVDVKVQLTHVFKQPLYYARVNKKLFPYLMILAIRIHWSLRILR